MRVDWRTFKRDPYFFLKYFSLQMLTSVALFGALYLLRDPLSETVALAWYHLLLLPVAVVLGIQLPAMLHNAVHFNFERRWLGEVVGELGGFFVLFGLGPFRISHFLHHAFADTAKDPHPPEGKGFLHFLATTQLNTIRVIRREFLEIHGDTPRTHLILAVEMLCYYVSLLFRIACWYWLLGPSFFVFFYLPAYVTNVLVFAHINFATHKTMPDGTVQVVNLNETLWHKTVNWLGSGVYFHRNHHLKPSLYNPARFVQEKPDGRGVTRTAGATPSRRPAKLWLRPAPRVS